MKSNSKKNSNRTEELTLTLEEAFNSIFHNNLNFDEFLAIDISKEYKEIHLNNRSNAISPSKLLRKYHKFINSFIFDYADINKNVVFSYREGKNAFDAIKKHSKSNYFFQTDIKGFFESIRTSDVGKIIDCNLSKSPINDIPKYKEIILDLVTINDKLPVGFSTSPNISNTFLYLFDKYFEEYCSYNKIIYTRYADDLIISSQESKYIDNIQNVILETFEKQSYKSIFLNSKKTKYTKKGRKIKLLGMIVLPSGDITIDPKLKSELEVLLHFYINDKEKFRSILKEKYENKISKISGKLNYINTIDKNYLDKLRRKYGNYIIDGFCHQTINKL